MKTSLLLRTLLLASTLATGAAQAADPQPAPAAPDIARLIAMLNQLAAETENGADAAADPAPAPVARETPAAPTPPASQPAPRLATSQLRTTSLTVSGPLGGRGTAAHAPATESTWRALFPLKQPRN